MEHFERTLASPVGMLRLVADDQALLVVSFMGVGHAPVIDARPVRAHPILELAARELELYFRGQLSHFQTPLRPEGTEFQRRAWAELLRIPYGERRSYGEQARAIGKPNASRAVGAANGRNPIAIIVPCHRVIGADGSLTGYGGGAENKAWLLAHEARCRPADQAHAYALR